MVDLITLPTVQFHVCSNGEIVEPSTGIVIDFVDYSPEIPLSTDIRTLIRHWDGMSAEPLGSIPKIIAFSKAEQCLLSKLRPLKFLKYAVKQDYMQLIDKINRQRFSTYMSIRLKNLWADPYSVYNSLQHSMRLSEATKRAWADPNSGLNAPETRYKMSISAKARCDRMTDRERDKASRVISNGNRRFRAWKRLSDVMKMLFDDVVIERETYPCPYCKKVFPTKMGPSYHIGKKHKDVKVTFPVSFRGR